MNKRSTIELIIIFIVTLIINLTWLNFNLDEIWSFGFSYNVSQGLIPYKDFNMVIFPFYPILNGLIMSLFGKNFLVFEITNAIICTAIFYYLKKLCPKNYYLIFIVLLSSIYANYSLLCLLLILIIINIEQKPKINHSLIGLLLGLLFITKQNIGIIFILPSIYLYYNKPKIILKRLLFFSIPIFFLIIYLLLTKSLFPCINYTILGLLDFNKYNAYINIQTFITIAIVLYILYRYFYKKDKKIILLYSLVSLFQNYPIFDSYHFLISIIPFSIYMLNRIKLPILAVKLTLFFIITIIIISIGSEILDNKKIFINNTNTFKYKALTVDQNKIINYVTDYIKNIPPQTKLFILDPNAYLYKLESNIDINKYDLINNGNMGYNGEETYKKEINDICNKEDCIILIDHMEYQKEYTQTNKELLRYVINNYQYQYKIGNLYVYKNKKEGN